MTLNTIAQQALEEHLCGLKIKCIEVEVSYFKLRRTSHICGSLIDSLNNLWNQLAMKYEEIFKKEYQDYNKNID